MENVINIGKRREVFWDTTMINEERTHTETHMHELIKRECVIELNDPWGSDGCNYISLLADDNGVYRMYVNSHRSYRHPEREKLPISTILYYESTDGIHWDKPNLGICEFEGSKDNNIMFSAEVTDGHGFDGFRAMKDPRPECPAEERYKAVADLVDKNGVNELWYFSSPDGIHFTKRYPFNLKGQFDSINTLLYDKERQCFRCYFRTYHPSPIPGDLRWFRDIRMSESVDLVNWTKPTLMHYDNYVDWQLYTNAISQYYRAEHIYVGFPARYIERDIKWAPNYDQLCGKEKRWERFHEPQPRTGIAVTDALFMTSHNGVDWTRYNNAFLRPGPECPGGWVYGSCYISSGMTETPSPYDGCSPEISVYCGENRWMGIPGKIFRYSIRLDGFVSQFAPWDSTWDYPMLVTKPFIFEGNDLYINFATSAYGAIYVFLKDLESGKELQSAEIFGDSTERKVVFENGSAGELAGKPVELSFKMRDADMYSFHFV